ncbi:MAG: trimethylamine methyltransferase family protein [Alphaproteobacteria bacterium]|nr:trimethylamine methyltransferase family protein [Alphaproteobacteria bacterium]
MTAEEVRAPNGHQRKRHGGRSANRRRRSTGVKQLPPKTFTNKFPHLEFLSADEIESIHENSLAVIRDIGMRFMHPEAIAILKKHGAEVTPDTDLVKMDPELVLEHVAKAPASFPLRSRNPRTNLIIGADEALFCSIGSAPNCSDLDDGRRPGNFADFKKLVRLTQAFNVLSVVGGYPVEPIDLSPNTRHLRAIQTIIEETDKPFMLYSLGRARILDGLETTRRGLDITDDDFEDAAYAFTVVNTSSPLRLDGPMIEGMIEMARRNQPVVITPFTLSGAMAPATIPGALVMQNAEALASIAFLQMIRPGARCIYGSFTSNVDMKSGSPAFGTPEYVKATLASGQLTRRYKIPMRTSNACAANAVDAQAAYEAMFSLWAVLLSGTHLCKHAGGWMEGGLVASYEKFVLDAELIQQFAQIMEPLSLDADGLALDAIREVGQGGHFFGTEHTIARYETAFYSPMISDWRNFGAWTEGGSPQNAEHCNRVWKEILADFEAPPLDPARREAMEAYTKKRAEEGGADSLPRGEYA